MNDIISMQNSLTVNLSAAKRYLLATGWRTLSKKYGIIQSGEPFEMYSRHDSLGGKLRVTLPVNNSAVDAPLRVQDAIQIVAELEDRPFDAVISSMLRVGYDVIRSSIPTEQVLDESIRLSAATGLISRMRGLLAATATTEKRPRPFFGRLLKDSVQYADTCRFGHTYRGSFGFVLESPLPPSNVFPLLENAPPTPFERRVVQRFARGIANIVRATELQDTKPLVDGVDYGFSANGCEQFADLIEEVNPAGLTFSVDLSPDWGESREMHNSHFTVSTEHIELCRAAARELRRDDSAVPVSIAGLIVRLQNQTDPTDFSNRTGEHEVMILWSSSDFGDIQVRVNLSPEDYLSSVSAHGTGRPVWVSGTLVRIGRQWSLLSPHSFSLRQQESFDFDKT